MTVFPEGWVIHTVVGQNDSTCRVDGREGRYPCPVHEHGGVIETMGDADESDAGDDRPEDCDCTDWIDGRDLPCWPCYRDEFDVADYGNERTSRSPAAPTVAA